MHKNIKDFQLASLTVLMFWNNKALMKTMIKTTIVRTDKATSELNSLMPDLAITAVKPAKNIEIRA